VGRDELWEVLLISHSVLSRLVLLMVVPSGLL
jgi:hypothetical protein